jgi:hypothetical protein|tara:strand:+ start:264 stop:692 length:429 start_codon:yes stop_codon:yes gene_type:complete
MNDDDYRELFIPLIDYLKEIGCDKQKHSGNRSLLHHLVGVSMILSEGNCSDALCVAGLFHSIYGTVVFRPKMVPMDDRDKIKDLIGIESENLVYQFCILPKDRRAGIYALEDGYVKKDLYDLTYANNEEQRLWREINNDTGL